MADNAKTGAELNDIAQKVLLRQDQLSAICENIPAAISANILVGAISLAVSLRHGYEVGGSIWFATVTIVNLVRLRQSFLPPPLRNASSLPAALHAVQRRLDQLCYTALISGLIWALIPALCAGYTSGRALFYLTSICGITAGAITHGTPYARQPTYFILPPLLSMIVCLVWVGGFDRNCLALAVFIYAVALLRFAAQSEASFKKTSILKNQAIALVDSLEDARKNAIYIAEQMSYRATHDDLTNLLNRSGFINEVTARLDGGHSSYCLMLLDLDGFKSINDAFGHHAGDKVLVEVARRLSETLGANFTLGRMGGDEFAVFYESADTEAFPAELATRLIASVAVPFVSFDAGRLGMCIGLYIGRGDDVTELLTFADEALYAAKAMGRNQYYVFDATLNNRLQMRRDIERDLHRALTEQMLEVWYQPIMHRDGKTLAGFEALLRWTHPQHGVVPPEELITIAAISGLAEPLLRFILGKICSMIRELNARGLQHLRIAMNISPREISRLAIDEILLATLKASGCPSAMLEVEVTEETALDIRSVQDKLIRLSHGGVEITIDDFGIGYSTLATLRHPYVNRIKIDRSFTRDIVHSEDNQVLVQSIVGMGHMLGINVVAEGVETAEDLAWLQKAGCDFLQGFHLHRPAPSTSVLAWLPLRTA